MLNFLSMLCSVVLWSRQLISKMGFGKKVIAERDIMDVVILEYYYRRYDDDAV